MKHPVRETLILIQLFLLINNTIKKTNMKNWKTSLFGLLVALCGVASTQLPQYKDIFVCAASLFTALAFHFAKDSDVTGGTTLQGPGNGVAKSLVLILGISLTSMFVNAQGPTGTINLTRQGQTVTGNNGDVEFSFGGVLATQSGFNYNPGTGVLSIDSNPVSAYKYAINVDTTSATGDTVVLKAGANNYIVTSNHALVLEIKNPVANTNYIVTFSSNVAAVSAVQLLHNEYSAVLPNTQYLRPTLWSFPY